LLRLPAAPEEILEILCPPARWILSRDPLLHPGTAGEPLLPLALLRRLLERPTLARTQAQS
jgi:hypothetical protein